MYTNMENIHIVVELLKKHHINQVVISPGGTNIAFIRAIQDDNFFSCYSVVDERSAAYFAIGIYLQTNAPVAILCTSAQATRNYIPGLTEAFYKRVPILAITMAKHPRFKYQEYMQAPDQTSLPKDAVKKSFELPFLADIHDMQHSIRMANEAMLELTRNGLGPVQLCIPWLDFPLEDQRPQIRTIHRMIASDMRDIDVSGKQVLLVIGEHSRFYEEDLRAINAFCERSNTVVYVNHLSNFKNAYSVKANLLLSCMQEEEFEEYKPDIIITLGGQTGDYPFFLKFFTNKGKKCEHWRISDDGAIVDTYDKLTKVFQGKVCDCMSRIACSDNGKHLYYALWKEIVEKRKNYPAVPFSNVAIAKYLHDKMPENTIIQFSILNSLRVWSLFDLNASIECYSNVGAFGIDGGLSTLIGQSVVSGKKSFMIIGDLAFFYDMNALGIRHIKNNVRILLINNNGGIEFKLHGGNRTEIDRFIAAGNHNKDAEGWSRTCGFQYLSAHNMNEFKEHVETFLGDADRPIVFEVFVTDEDERDAYHSLIEANRIKTTGESIKGSIKNSVKGLLGEKAYQDLKRKIKNS